MSRWPAFRRAAAAAALALSLAGLPLLAGDGPAAADVRPVRSVAEVTGGATALTVSADPATVARGHRTTVAGRLTDPASGAGVAGATVALEVRGPGGAWAPTASATTDWAGSVAVDAAVGTTTSFRLHFGAPGAPEEATSTVVTVAARDLTAQLSTGAVRVGRPVRLTGVLAAGGGRALRVERRVAGRWSRLAGVTTGADGSYSVTVTPTGPGWWRLRVARGPVSHGGVAAYPRPLDAYRLHTYSVRGRGAARSGLGAFRAEVAATYADPRGWRRAHHRFRPALPGRSGDFSVVLSSARYLPRFSASCSAAYSCRVGRAVVINQRRWRTGSPHFPGTLEQYRAMLVNHETGHWLGRGHAYCPGPGRPAPVMQQQSKGLQGCRVNSWPLPGEVRAVR